VRRSYAIVNAKVFDGHAIRAPLPVACADGAIVAIGETPRDAEVIDGRGCTILPGLIDAHVHPSEQGLRQALTFGVTTVLEMGGAPRGKADRAKLAANDRLADLRTAGVPLTAECGHPNQLLVGRDKLFSPDGRPRPEAQHLPGLAEGADLREIIARRIDEGSDFIKLHVEDGAVLGEPGLPQLDASVVATAVREAHGRGKLIVAHALTYQATQTVVGAGVDGLTHIFLDRPHTSEIVDAIVEAGLFVIPCLVINRSITGTSASDLAADPRVLSRLDQTWLRALKGSFSTWPSGDFADCLRTVAALHRAGVPILAGTDSSAPDEWGVAQGASLHQELQLLVQAGLSPLEALQAATSVPAKQFRLDDRGVIRVGARADLLLVRGDPTEDISATLATRAVWRRGVMSGPEWEE
jgi:imidazolonepropionase-like amidohydrolase